LSTQTIVVAGVTSGVGKSSVATALMYSLIKKGYKVQPFKVGPDFIDPTYHTLITGRQSRNLDVWMMRENGVLSCFYDNCLDADIAVVEGVMGIFDGVFGKNDYASTAHVARLLNATVILVIDAAKAARSLAATALGFIRFSKTLKVHGIILNNIASSRHAAILREAFAEKVSVPVVGMIRRNYDITMPERRLGLIPAASLDESKKKAIINSARFIKEQIQLEKIINLLGKPHHKEIRIKNARQLEGGLKVAVALDESFNFYYSDNIDALRREQINLIFFSPIHDVCLPPNISGVILGGGFPEILAEQLSKNQSMRSSILKAAEIGTPIYAECGGLMYLSNSIMDDDSGQVSRKNPKKKMVGLIDADTVMTRHLTLGYTSAKCGSLPFENISNLRGHEFHYSKINNIQRDSKFAYTLLRGSGVDGRRDGFKVYNCLASFMHLHFADTRLPQRLADTFKTFHK
jgi:cobyrinic acid a,c-diamide synthase